MAKKHIGFKAAMAQAAANGAKNPAAAVAVASQHASVDAKRRNPRLRKVATKGSRKNAHGYFV